MIRLWIMALLCAFGLIFNVPNLLARHHHDDGVEESEEFEDEDDREENEDEDDEDWDEEEEEDWEERAERLEQFLRKQLPSIVKELEELEDENEEAFEEVIDEWMEWFENYENAREDSPELAANMLTMVQLEIKADQITEKLHEAKGDNRKAIVKNLRTVLEQLFDAQLKFRWAELKMLEEEMTEIKTQITKRKKNREKIIDRRLKQLGEDAEDDDLDWW